MKPLCLSFPICESHGHVLILSLNIVFFFLLYYLLQEDIYGWMDHGFLFFLSGFNLARKGPLVLSWKYNLTSYYHWYSVH